MRCLQVIDQATDRQLAFGRQKTVGTDGGGERCSDSPEQNDSTAVFISSKTPRSLELLKAVTETS
jgi:hypothetical protein